MFYVQREWRFGYEYLYEMRGGEHWTTLDCATEYEDKAVAESAAKRVGGTVYEWRQNLEAES